jgi:hypothetical protein
MRAGENHPTTRLEERGKDGISQMDSVIGGGCSVSLGVTLHAIEIQNLIKSIFSAGLLVMLLFCGMVLQVGAASRLVTIGCGDPQGVTFYGSKLDIAERFGSAPKFILDPSDPIHLIVLWGSYIDSRLPEHFVDELELRAKAVKATIVYRSEDQITATRTDGQGLYVYTLYPKLEVGVFSSHRHWTTGETAAHMYYGHCKFLEQMNER